MPKRIITLPNERICGAYLEGRVFNEKWPRKTKFVKGHRLAARENMSPQSHAKRMAGLAKASKVFQMISRLGYKALTIKTKRERKKIGFKAFLRHKRARQTLAVKNVREIQQIALNNSAQAMRVAVEVMNDRRARGSERLAAVDLVLNRAAGRPTQTNINASLDANAPAHEASGKELDQRVAETLNRIEKLTGGKREKKPRERKSINIRVDYRDPGSSKLN